jgi:hypothetical protein
MKKVFVSVFLIFLYFLTANEMFFSPTIRFQRIFVPPVNEVIVLNHRNIIVHSEKVWADSILWNREEAYRFDYFNGTITFFHPVDYICLEYQIVPENLLREYYLYQEIPYQDSVQFIRPYRLPFASSENLTITGSKTLSISVASDKEFSFQQSLFLNIKGELSDNLFIEAQLSDSQSPITPEGDSREISTLDQLFIRLYGKQYEIALGDLEMHFQETKFISQQFKFEGLKFGYFLQNEYNGALAISKGKRTTITFNGLNAKQGPYYLQIRENMSVKVIPGTEQLFLNGISMQRGVDYTIDYSEGSVTFSNRHFITNESFIEVSFQYTDEHYKQNLYLASSDTKLSDSFILRSYFIFEQDDKHNPLQFTFTPADIDSLRNGGDGTVIGNGIFEVDAMEGLYELSDDGDFYVFSDSTGTYLLTFYFAGINQGNYALSGTGNYYVFVGDNNGNYRIGKELAAPHRKLNYDAIFQFQNDNFVISNEFIFTNHDRNLFSSIDDEDNTGFANHSEITITLDYDKIKPSFMLYYQKKSRDLSTFAQLSSALDKYELFQEPDTLASDEFGSTLRLHVWDIWQPFIKYSYKSVTSYSTLHYIENQHRIKQISLFPQIQYRGLWTKQEFQNETEGLIHLFILQNELNSQYSIGKMRFGSELYQRNWQAKYRTQIKQELVKRRWKTFLATERWQKFNGELYYQETWQDSLIGTVKSDKKKISIGIKSNYQTDNHNFRTDYSHHILQDTITVSYDLAEAATRHSIINSALVLQTGYGIRNVQFYPKVRELIYVGTNIGSYEQDSTFVGVGEGDYNWEITSINYSNPQLSVEVQGNVTIFLKPKTITKSFLKKFQSESFWQVLEHSQYKQKEKIYYFHLDFVMNKEETLYGYHQFRHIFWYDILPHRILPRISIENRYILDNRYQLPERTKTTSWEIMCQFLKIIPANVEVRYEQRHEEESRYQSIVNNQVLTLDIRTRFWNSATLSSAAIYADENGKSSVGEKKYTLKSMEFAETLNCFLSSKYRIYARFSIKQNQRKGDFLSGLAEKSDGIISKWNSTVDYKINNYTTAKFVYSGKSYPNQKDTHQIELEVRAEF